MYVVAEDATENEEILGNIVTVSSVWLTPRKLESFWPTAKFSAQYIELLQKHENPAEDWPIIKLSRKFFKSAMWWC